MTDETTRRDEKKERLLFALEKGMTQIHLDARRPGVLVPERFRTEHHLVLNVSYRFDPPDLSVNEWGIRQTLSFAGQRFTVGIPWSATYALASLVTREFWMYPDDMPVELADAATEKVSAEDLSPGMKTTSGRAPTTPHLAVLKEVVMETESASSSGTEEESPKDPTPPRRGHLRVVK